MTELDEVHKLVSKGDLSEIRKVLNSNEGLKYLPEVIEDLATSNQKDLLLELLANTIYYPQALKAAAKAGHHHLVETLLDKLSSENKNASELQAALTYTLEGYSEGKYLAKAAHILELGVNPMFCLNALAVDGRIEPNDALKLLTSIKNEVIKDRLKKLMRSQFE